MEVSTAMEPSAAPTGGQTFGWRKRWLGRLSLVVGVFLSLYILLIANIIVYRHPQRHDLTQERLQSVSERTKSALARVREEIRIIIPTYLQGDNPRHHAELEVLERAGGLLEEYVSLQPHLKMEAEINVFSDPERWERLRTDFDLSETDLNRIIFLAGADNDFRQIVTPVDLARFSKPRDPTTETPQILEFRGDKALTDAILRIVDRERKPIYFTQSKQEMRLFPLGRAYGRGGHATLNHLRRELDTFGFASKELDLRENTVVPEDCEAIIVAAPFESYSRGELQVLRRYLERGGRMFVALGPRTTGLENVLADWGVGVREGSIYVKQDFVAKPEVVIRLFNRSHPVTSVFLNARFELRLFGARALMPQGEERNLLSTTLLTTASAAGESHFLGTAGVGGRTKVLDQGEYPVAVAVEQRKPERPPPNFQDLDTRLVVVGAANFLADGDFDGSNRDFFMNCVAWLVGQEEKVSVGGQEWAQRTIDMSGGFRSYVKWVPLALFPGVLLFLGVFVYYLRRV